VSDLEDALAETDPSVRLKAVMAAGITPSPADLDALVERCAVEPDFQVREMLTWALIRLPKAIVLPRIIAQLTRAEPQARSQALHTLSKLKDGSAWPSVVARLDDDDAAVMRTAWYAAVALVPDAERPWLASKLAEQLGRGDWEARLSLSRALVGLGGEVSGPVLATAAKHPDGAIESRAEATLRLQRDPDAAFDDGVYRARREVGSGRARSAIG
jgi:HEAT repeat protein